MQPRADPSLIIRIDGPDASYVTREAERIRELYKYRSSISRPLPHNKTPGWWMVYVDVFPVTDLPPIVESEAATQLRTEVEHPRRASREV